MSLNLLRLFHKYRLVIRFIAIFLGSYFVLTSFYSAYLIFFEGDPVEPDPLTQLVAYQSGALMEGFGYEVEVVMHYTGLSMKLMVEEIFLAGIVEGCNSASIIILFTSFILAFFGRTSSTIFFLIAGSALIYSINIIRIVLLSVGLYEVPKYSEFLHTIFFPLAIYGTVFILWIIWIRIYTKWKRELR